MNKFLTSVGFHEYDTNTKIKELKKEVVESPSRKEVYALDRDEHCFVYEKDYGECFGLCVIKVGESEKESDIDSFFPYVRGYNYLFNDSFEMNHFSDREGYYGNCDDNNIGIPMIFFINNPMEYHKMEKLYEQDDAVNCVTLSGLASDGVVLLPIESNEYRRKHERRKIKKRNDMIDAARSGDLEAMENLTIEDMSMYTTVNLRSKREDLFTIVTSYFMPHTVECDKYAVLAEITDVSILENSKTKEELYYMSLNCNSIDFEVMINKKDLLGIPEKGRRVKCHVWMQGQMDHL